jgi:hypothetical protein
MLRPGPEGKYRVVGECYVCGLEDAKALLGPLGDDWTVQVFAESTDYRRNFKFLNKETGVLTDDDPRLPPLPSQWERIETEMTSGPTTFQLFKNGDDGRTINYDPRMTPNTFESKGVAIERFILV